MNSLIVYLHYWTNDLSDDSPPQWPTLNLPKGSLSHLPDSLRYLRTHTLTHTHTRVHVKHEQKPTETIKGQAYRKKQKKRKTHDLGEILSVLKLFRVKTFREEIFLTIFLPHWKGDPSLKWQQLLTFKSDIILDWHLGTSNIVTNFVLSALHVSACSRHFTWVNSLLSIAYSVDTLNNPTLRRGRRVERVRFILPQASQLVRASMNLDICF